jgi:ABC-type uncharacterized transport system fused permease/ATPase subunit
MNAKLNAEHRSTGSLIKKITVIRILLRRPKIVIFKDTDEFIDNIHLTELFKNELPGATIIKISRSIEECLFADRIIAMEQLSITEDGSPD